MKTRKLRLLSALLALAMLLALLPTAAFAEDNIFAHGTCGARGSENSVTWKLDSDGTLTISGKGKIRDASENNLPCPYPYKIKKVIVENGVTEIGRYDFYNCTNLTEVDLSNVQTLENIGENAFSDCSSLSTVKLPMKGKLKSIGTNAFGFLKGVAPQIREIMIPASVKEILGYVFNGCKQLGNVEFAEGSKLETIGKNAFSDCHKDLIIYYSNKEVKQALTGAGVSADRIKPANPTVTFISNGGSNVEPATVKNGEAISAPADPTREGWDFAGWYTKDANDKWADEAFNFNTPIKNDMTLYARWATALVPITPAVELYPITIDYGTAYDAEGNPIEKAAAGDVVTIKADETALEGMTFERWEVRKGEVKLENDRAAETSFTMPAGEVQLEAMYQAADVHDSGWDAAAVVTGVAIGTGTAILAYHIGLEVYAEQVLGKGVAVPRTRSEVALLAWQLAGSPAVNVEGEPLSEAAQAERWAVESGLMEPDAEGNFNGAKKMSKLKALRTLEKAKQ
ncbi:MAG: hypothetical protein EGQ64_03285 [Ruminococcaceae bacterium]|nr:hypothetical protein [Oscillospiraceae bacterium]